MTDRRADLPIRDDFWDFPPPYEDARERAEALRADLSEEGQAALPVRAARASL